MFLKLSASNLSLSAISTLALVLCAGEIKSDFSRTTSIQASFLYNFNTPPPAHHGHRLCTPSEFHLAVGRQGDTRVNPEVLGVANGTLPQHRNEEYQWSLRTIPTHHFYGKNLKIINPLSIFKWKLMDCHRFIHHFMATE